MSVTFTALYNPPADPELFDKHYDEVHTPLLAKLPNLEALTVVRPLPGPDGEKPAYHLIASLTFPSPQALQEAMASPEGQAAQEDIPNVAKDGVTTLVGPKSRVV